MGLGGLGGLDHERRSQHAGGFQARLEDTMVCFDILLMAGEVQFPRDRALVVCAFNWLLKFINCENISEMSRYVGGVGICWRRDLPDRDDCIGVVSPAVHA